MQLPQLEATPDRFICIIDAKNNMKYSTAQSFLSFLKLEIVHNLSTLELKL